MVTIERNLCQLADENFKRDLGSRLKKLIEEVSELAEAVVNKDNEEIGMEAADCSFLLMDIVHLAGGSLTEYQKKKWKVLIERRRLGILQKVDRMAKLQ